MTIVRRCVALVAGALLVAPLAAAQQELSPEGVEIAHDAAELQEVLRPAQDIDFTDTAMVFTNTSRGTARVSCVGYDRNGGIVGRIWLRVPGQGLRFALASDLSDDADFIGSARCWTRAQMIGSAFLLRPGAVTDLPSHRLPGLLEATAEALPKVEPAPLASDVSPSGDVAELPKPIPIYPVRIRFPVVATY